PVANGTRLVFDLKAQAGLDTSLSDLPNATGQELVLRLNLGPMAKQMQATADKKKQQPEAVATKPVLPDTPPPPSVSAQPSGEKGPAVAESTPGKLPDSDSGSTEPAVPYCPSDRVTPKKRPPTIREQRQYEACRKNGGMVIVVDPGHGGIDPGAIGHEGTKEKNVTLEVAKRLFQKLDGVQNCKVVLTREDDRFLTLRNRIAIARQAQADLFLSLHADAYRNPIIHGASVFCLADGVQIAIDEKDQQLAHRENTSGNLHASVNPDGNQDSVLELLQLDAIKRMAIADSVRFGHKLIQSLGSQPGVSIHYPRVKRVNFLVLKNPGIPSSLVEMAFLSNVKDEQRMINSEYQERIAQGLASGIFKYFHLPTTDKA
ncbi:MAG TPA: N-acetylmuramoyl-L-alanine amidase, partial [Magnetococcales bacterium]|nr:N-acetylmuramoyl-L-alanine amidase [Magnetococcales bacterium]